MAENLIGASAILLFGRVVDDVQLVAARKSAKSASAGANHFLADQRAADGACLARIYL